MNCVQRYPGVACHLVLLVTGYRSERKQKIKRKDKGIHFKEQESKEEKRGLSDNDSWLGKTIHREP